MLDIRWVDSVKNWHSLDDSNLSYFDEIVEALYVSDEVLRGILKLINGIGSLYMQEGIAWIARQVNLTNGFSDIEIDSDLQFYIEITMRKYLSQHRQNIRIIKRRKAEFITVLNWLVEMESVIGYMIRDEIV